MSFERSLRAIVGDAGWINEDQRAPYLQEWRGRYDSDALAVVAPSDVEQVRSIVRLCAQHKVSIVPQGGNTGLCGGAVSTAKQVLLSLSKMNAVREVNAANFSMVVDAGCVLANAQAQADAHERLLGLSLAAEGSCQIGGNLSTNAGGVNVLRYGTARDQVLGLEVVLADGRLLSDLSALRKNTAGYDLKQLFIGAEGTLGIITAATLRLQPKPALREVFWLGLESLEQVIELFARTRLAFGNTIAAFELVSDRALSFVSEHIAGARSPLADSHPQNVLIEISGGEGEVSAQFVQAFIQAQIEQLLVADAVVASSLEQRDALWALRHHISEAQRSEGVSLKHDIALPIDKIAAFVGAATASLETAMPDIRVVCFGHVGDGNLHFNLSQPKAMSEAAFRTHETMLTGIVYDTCWEHDGTISAEHGVGLLKREQMHQQVGETKLAVMRALKQTMDPDNLFNPGKVL